MKTIYVLCDPRSGEPRYVGATVSTLAKRLGLHLVMAPKNTSACAKWIQGLIAEGNRPIIKAVDALVADWQSAERGWIVYFKERGYQILNQTEGGMGMRGCRPSEETRAKRSKTLKTLYESDAKLMAYRQELARQASRSDAGRKAASVRMKAIWSDPVRAAEMSEKMRGKHVNRSPRSR